MDQYLTKIRGYVEHLSTSERQISKPIWNYMNVQGGGEQEGGYRIAYGWHPWLLGRPTLSIKNMKKFSLVSASPYGLIFKIDESSKSSGSDDSPEKDRTFEVEDVSELENIDNSELKNRFKKYLEKNNELFSELIEKDSNLKDDELYNKLISKIEKSENKVKVVFNRIDSMVFFMFIISKHNPELEKNSIRNIFNNKVNGQNFQKKLDTNKYRLWKGENGKGKWNIDKLRLNNYEKLKTALKEIFEDKAKLNKSKTQLSVGGNEEPVTSNRTRNDALMDHIYYMKAAEHTYRELNDRVENTNRSSQVVKAYDELLPVYYRNVNMAKKTFEEVEKLFQ